MTQKYPHYVLVYKDEYRFLINPWLVTKQGYRSNSSWIKILDAKTKIENIIAVVSEAFVYAGA